MTRPRYKTRYDPNDPGKTNPISTWIDTRNSDVDDDAVLDLTAALNTAATQELRAIFDHNQVFSYPKPVSLVKELVRAATDKDSFAICKPQACSALSVVPCLRSAQANSQHTIASSDSSFAA